MEGMKEIIATVYMCPQSGCRHYFAGSGITPEAMEKTLGEKTGNFEVNPPEKHFRRIECPECRVRGIKVDRVAVDVALKVPFAPFARQRVAG